MASSRAVGKLAVESTAFLLCDIQERFRGLIQHMPSVIHVANTMVKASKILNIPLFATEQYPKALGNTVEELDLSVPTLTLEKYEFSMVPVLSQHLRNREALKSVVLFGIEAHVCVLQTALDLSEQGYEVHVLADGTSSTRQADRFIAFERMRQAGVYVSTSESVLFQLMQTSRHPCFKQISALVKAERPDPGLARL